MRVVLVAVTAALALATGCGLGDGSNSRNASAMDGGICIRDVEAIEDLLAHPVACVTDVQCPNGAFCEAGRGACDWQCTADSHCGPGNTCGCDGRCVIAGGPADPATNRCERNDALLTSLTTQPRSCTFDEQCPNGSRCDEGTRTCVFDCQSDAACDDGEACDCLGHCVVPGETPPRPSDRLARLDITPRRSPVVAGDDGHSAWSPRRLQISVTAPDTTIGTSVADADVDVKATPGLLVACDNTSSGTDDPTAPDESAFQQRCALTSRWEFRDVGPEHLAAKFVWVAPAPVTPPATYVTEGDVVITSDRLGRGSTVSFVTSPAADPSGATPPTSYPLQGTYEGTITALGATSVAPVAPAPAAAVTAAPITAYIAGSGSALVVDIADHARVVSSTGKLRATPSDSLIVWVVPDDGSDDERLEFERVTANVIIRESSHEPATGGFSALVDVMVWPWGWARYRLDLRRTGDLVTCGSDSCPPAATCVPVVSVNVCELGPAPEPSTDTGGTFVDARWLEWQEWLVELARRARPSSSGDRPLASLYVADLYDPMTGFARGATAAAPVVNAGNLQALNNDAGADLCATHFADYIGWLNSEQVNGFPLRAEFTFSTLGDDWGGVTTVPQWCALFYANRNTELAPCINQVAESAPVGDWFAQVNLNPRRRGSCRDVYTTWKAATGSSLTEASFYSQRCQDTAIDLRLGRESDFAAGESTSELEQFAKNRVRLCPFEEQMLSSSSLADATSFLCYHTEGSTEAPLLSASFAGPLTVSGDLACTGGHAPHGVDALVDADRAALERVATTPAGRMLARCIDELAEVAPASWIRGAEYEDVVAAYEDTFEGHSCFSPAAFYGALGELVSASDPASNRLRLRLISEWLTAHTFLARESSEASAIARSIGAGSIVDGDDESAVDDTPTQETVLAAMARGWDLLLDFRLLPYAMGSELRDPDYRPATAPAGDADVPPPVHILETASAHLALLEGYLRGAQLRSYDACRVAGTSRTAEAALALAGRASRYITAAELIATNLYDRATAQACTTSCAGGATCDVNTGTCYLDGAVVRAHAVPWQSRYDLARTEFEAVRQRAVDAAADLGACRSPVGVDERAVPLYFGDATGTSGRFFAASDYLLTGWAKPAAEHAVAALEAARNAWVQQRNSEIQDLVSEQEAERRIEQIGGGYGESVVQLCGLENIEPSDALTRLAAASAQDVDACFIDRARPECGYLDQPPPAGTPVPPGDSATAGEICTLPPHELHETTAALTAKDVKLQLCMLNELNLEMSGYLGDNHPGGLAYRGPGTPGNAGRAFLRVLDMAADWEAAGIVDVEYAHGEGPPGQGFCGVVTHDQTPSSANAEMLSFVHLAFSKRLIPSVVPQRRLDAAHAHCVDLMEGKAPSAPEPDLTSRAQCFRGTLGEQFLGVAGAKKDVDRAIGDWKDGEESYFTAIDRCNKLRTWQTSLEQLTADHEATMERFHLARFVSGSASVMINAYIASGGIPGPVAARRAKSTAVDLGFSVVLQALGSKRQDAEDAYQAQMRRVQQEKELYDCYEEARSLKLRIDNAMSAVERAIIEADRHVVAFANQQRALRGALTVGSAAVEREVARTAPSVAFHYWLDERIDRFHKDFEWARSLVYLAVLAVEFEYQQSMSLRGEILEATHPDQLLDAIRLMEQTQISRTINGRRPEEDTIVRSVAYELLDLTTLEPATSGEREWTALERFQSRLWSSEYAVYDDNGRYLGQGVPFSVEPEGELENACAERLWRVTATVQGDTLSESQPSVPVTLLKRNHFGSQWCSGRGEEGTLQMASLQPVSRLFHPEDRGGAEAETDLFTSARMRPYFNVPRSAFYSDAYTEGASAELAGRGLYGDYILLFPASGLLDTGFPLEKVEDVLVRFDYLSVDDIALGNNALTSDSER